MKGRVVRSWGAPLAAALVISAVSISAPRPAIGYAGEAGSGDGPVAAYQGLAVSTHHTHLTRALAYNDHAFEFGCPDTRRRAGFLEGTVQGGIAVFDELLGYALANGFTPRVASVDAHGGWLRRQIERYAMSFRNNLTADAGTCRVSFTYAPLQACGGIQPGQTGCLPDVAVEDGGTCAAGGQTSGCSEGTAHFPMTPACGAIRNDAAR